MTKGASGLRLKFDARSPEGSTAYKVFDHAYRFHRASLCLRSTDNPNAINYALPAIHLQYIALELFLKCLAADHTGAVSKGHDVSRLFAKLRDDDKLAVSERWQQWLERHVPTLPPDLMALLPQNRDLASFLKRGEFMFLSSRYRWENSGGEKALYLVGEVPAMLCDRILERHPDWAPPQRPASR